MRFADFGPYRRLAGSANVWTWSANRTLGVIEPRRRAFPTVDVETALADVTKRLTKRFEGQVPPDIVAATVRSCANRWAGARVVEFVPLLTERHSIEQLRVSTVQPTDDRLTSTDRTRVTVVASS